MFSGIGGFEYGIIKAIYNSETSRLAPEGRGTKEVRGQGSSNKVKYGRQFSNGSRRTIGVEVIGFSEIDKYASSVYKRHFPETKNYGDATAINPRDLPDFSLLVGGFPCQSFSIAGKGNGFEDARGTLFFDIARILSEKRPRYFILENVRGLLSNKSGETFQKILGVLSDLGYEYQWELLNSSSYSLAQNRERIFIVGNLRGEPRPEIFPICRDDFSFVVESGDEEKQKDGEGLVEIIYDGLNDTLKSGTKSPTISSVNCISVTNRTGFGIVDGKEKASLKQIGSVDQTGHNSIWARVYDPSGKSVSLNSQAGGTGAKTGLYFVGGIGEDDRIGDGKKLSRNFRQGNRVHSAKGKAGAISAQPVGGKGGHTGLYAVSTPQKILHATITGAIGRQGSSFEYIRSCKSIDKATKADIFDKKTKGLIRRLTPTECERLQGFSRPLEDGSWSDGWTEAGINESNELVKISDSQRYKMLGNAVSTNVVEAIMIKLFRHIIKEGK